MQVESSVRVFNPSEGISFKDHLSRLMQEDDHATRFSSYNCMTPDTLRDVSPSSFTPRMVSIGPLHRENKNLIAFHGRKASYVINLTARICGFTGEQEQQVYLSCMQKMRPSLGRIRKCYIWEEQERRINDAELAEMMFMDACFILEFVFQMSEGNESSKGTFVRQQAITYDLALLENQIPFFVLNDMFECTILKLQPSSSLVSFLHPLLKHLNLFKTDIEIPNISINHTPHILGLLHQCYIPLDKIKSDLLSSTNHSAVDLDRAGVNFKPNQSPKWLMEMNVILHGRPSLCLPWSSLTLTMPVLDIHHFTELVLRNLIAYKQLFDHNAYYITSYVIAIDRMVNTEEDVAKLVERGVLDNRMGSNEEATNMINSLCKEVAGLDFFYGEQWNTMNRFCNGYWPKKIAWVKRTYFRSPWNMIALIAGIILFALTIIQTVFTITSA